MHPVDGMMKGLKFFKVLCLTMASAVNSFPSISANFSLFRLFTAAFVVKIKTLFWGIWGSFLVWILDFRVSMSDDSSPWNPPTLIFSHNLAYSRLSPCLWLVLKTIGTNSLHRLPPTLKFLCWWLVGSSHGYLARTGFSWRGSPRSIIQHPPNSSGLSFTSLKKYVCQNQVTVWKLNQLT